MDNYNIHLLAIKEYYGDKCAKRTEIPYINHIHEGLKVLELIHASKEAAEAYCLHPIYQVEKNPENNPIVIKYGHLFNPHSVELAKNYAKAANSYLCKKHYKSADDVVKLSSYPEVNDMLIADKIQNRKDFELHYENQEDKNVFDRSDNLSQYFKNWLKALGVNESTYESIKTMISHDISL